jgi:hypothetical protein
MEDESKNNVFGRRSGGKRTQNSLKVLRQNFLIGTEKSRPSDRKLNRHEVWSGGGGRPHHKKQRGRWRRAQKATAIYSSFQRREILIISYHSEIDVYFPINLHWKQEVLGRTNRLLFFILHGPHWKRRIQQFFNCCVCICYRGNVCTEPLPSNIQTQRLMGGIC